MLTMYIAFIKKWDMLFVSKQYFGDIHKWRHLSSGDLVNPNVAA